MRLLDTVPREKLEAILAAVSRAVPAHLNILDHEGRVLVGKPIPPSPRRRVRELRIGQALVGHVVSEGQDPTSVTQAERAIVLLTSHLEGAVRDLHEIELLSAEIVRSYRILNVIYELNRRLGAVLDIPTIGEICIEETLNGIVSDRAALVLQDPTDHAWVVVSQRGQDGAGFPAGHRFQPDVFQEAVRAAPSVLCDDASNLMGPLTVLHRSPLVEFPLLWVVLQVKDNAIGFILLSRPSSGTPFLTDDLKLLQAIASCAATVVQNVRLVQDLQHSLTELQERAETIREMHQALLLSQKMSAIGQLAATVVHDIRNPMTVISAYAQLLNKGEMLTETKEFGDAILEACGQVTQITTRILDFCRQRPPEKRSEDINEIIRNLLTFAEYYLVRSRKIQVQRDLASELPPVWVDRGQIQEAFFNIIMNSCHAMEQGGCLTIHTESVPATSGSARVRISFTDTGCGIPPETLKQIFKPFVTTRRPGEGTGLGLAICHRIFTEHGGTIRVESELGRGTTFLIELPGMDVPSTSAAVCDGSQRGSSTDC